jgi:hypothetical protein
MGDFMSRTKTEVRLAYTVLEWARTPGPHGGNPYRLSFVKEAERIVAKHECRDPESWAQKVKGQRYENDTSGTEQET